MKKAGMPAPTTDTAELAARAFAHLDGVSDEWIEKTEVKKVAGGQNTAGNRWDGGCECQFVKS